MVIKDFEDRFLNEIAQQSQITAGMKLIGSPLTLPYPISSLYAVLSYAVTGLQLYDQVLSPWT